MQRSLEIHNSQKKLEELPKDIQDAVLECKDRYEHASSAELMAEFELALSEITRGVSGNNSVAFLHYFILYQANLFLSEIEYADFYSPAFIAFLLNDNLFLELDECVKILVALIALHPNKFNEQRYSQILAHLSRPGSVDRLITRNNINSPLLISALLNQINQQKNTRKWLDSFDSSRDKADIEHLSLSGIEVLRRFALLAVSANPNVLDDIYEYPSFGSSGSKPISWVFVSSNWHGDISVLMLMAHYHEYDLIKEILNRHPNSRQIVSIKSSANVTLLHALAACQDEELLIRVINLLDPTALSAAVKSLNCSLPASSEEQVLHQKQPELPVHYAMKANNPVAFKLFYKPGYMPVEQEQHIGLNEIILFGLGSPRILEHLFAHDLEILIDEDACDCFASIIIQTICRNIDQDEPFFAGVSKNENRNLLKSLFIVLEAFFDRASTLPERIYWEKGSFPALFLTSFRKMVNAIDNSSYYSQATTLTLQNKYQEYLRRLLAIAAPEIDFTRPGRQFLFDCRDDRLEDKTAVLTWCLTVPAERKEMPSCLSSEGSVSEELGASLESKESNQVDGLKKQYWNLWKREPLALPVSGIVLPSSK